MKNVFSLILFFATSMVQAAGFYELDYDWNRPGKQVATVVVGASAGIFVPMLVVDSTGYYEGFVGYPMKLGPVSVVSHLGIEGLKGANPRVRGLTVTSTEIGPIKVAVVNEFGGVTGNFHKERVWVDVGPYGFGLVRHSSAGLGPRIDYRLGNKMTVYFQYLPKNGTSRPTLALSGVF